MQALMAQAERIGEQLKARKERVAVAESSSGGLISAALLSVPGASAYYLGGGVVYTPKARVMLMDIPREALEGMRSASEPYALLLARTVRERFGATWGVSETGAAGPTGNRNTHGDRNERGSDPGAFLRDGELARERGPQPDRGPAAA